MKSVKFLLVAVTILFSILAHADDDAKKACAAKNSGDKEYIPASGGGCQLTCKSGLTVRGDECVADICTRIDDSHGGKSTGEDSAGKGTKNEGTSK